MGLGRWVLAAAVGVAALNLPACTSTAPYDFAVFGDVPYSAAAATKFDTMIGAINAGTPSFSVHVGDIGSGASACTTSKVDTETARFDTFAKPMIFTPGDNEWTDCGAAQASQLAYIRTKIFRGTGTQSRGLTTLPLQSQSASGYPENARWTKGPITFATLHLVGSSDNYANRTEHDARRAATITWLQATFAAAKSRGDKGIVLIAQAEPAFGGPTTAYQSMYDAIRTEALAYSGQILFLHGDGHVYQNDYPLAGVPNLHRVEVEGSAFVSFVKVHVDPTTAGIFTVTPPTRF